MRLLAVVLLLAATQGAEPVRAAGASTSVVLLEGPTELASDFADLGESVSVASGGASASGLTDVGVHEGALTGYAWPEGPENAFMRAELLSTWFDLVQLTGGETGTLATITAIAGLESAHSIDGEVGPKGAGSALDYDFEVRVDGFPTSKGYSRFVFQAPGDPLIDTLFLTPGTNFANGEFAASFDVPYGETVRIQSRASPFTSENASVAIVGSIGIRFEIPPGSALVSTTPGVSYVTTVPEASSVLAAIAALAALAAIARRS